MGQDRTGQDRTGQDRTGKDRMRETNDMNNDNYLKMNKHRIPPA